MAPSRELQPAVSADPWGELKRGGPIPPLQSEHPHGAHVTSPPPPPVGRDTSCSFNSFAKKASERESLVSTATKQTETRAASRCWPRLMVWINRGECWKLSLSHAFFLFSFFSQVAFFFFLTGQTVVLGGEKIRAPYNKRCTCFSQWRKAVFVDIPPVSASLSAAPGAGGCFHTQSWCHRKGSAHNEGARCQNSVRLLSIRSL